MKKKASEAPFDPLAYIESAFLDRSDPGQSLDEMPSLGAYLRGEVREPRERFRKTAMSAPRPRRRGKREPEISPELETAWRALPKNVAFLLRYHDDGATSKYYKDFEESREDLVRRLLDPELNLEEASRLLGVVPATVRRYTNRGWLECDRTKGGQRRFRLSALVRFVEQHGRFPEGEPPEGEPKA